MWEINVTVRTHGRKILKLILEKVGVEGAAWIEIAKQRVQRAITVPCEMSTDRKFNIR